MLLWSRRGWALALTPALVHVDREIWHKLVTGIMRPVHIVRVPGVCNVIMSGMLAAH